MDEKFKNTLKIYKFKCFNSPCPWEGLAEELESHLNGCIFKWVKCEFCEKTDSAMGIEEHTKVCQFRKYTCDKCLSLALVTRKFHHDINECLGRFKDVKNADHTHISDFAFFRQGISFILGAIVWYFLAISLVGR